MSSIAGWIRERPISVGGVQKEELIKPSVRMLTKTSHSNFAFAPKNATRKLEGEREKEREEDKPTRCALHYSLCPLSRGDKF